MAEEANSYPSGLTHSTPSMSPEGDVEETKYIKTQTSTSLLAAG
jgi:hypothetical protein